MVILLSYVCVGCGQRTAQGICPTCRQETMPTHLIPTRCLDCGAPLRLPPHLRSSLGQCEDCSTMNPRAIGLWAWNDLLCNLV
jgi:hypothetical protein